MKTYNRTLSPTLTIKAKHLGDFSKDIQKKNNSHKLKGPNFSVSNNGDVFIKKPIWKGTLIAYTDPIKIGKLKCFPVLEKVEGK